MKNIIIIFLLLTGFVFYSDEYKNNVKAIRLYETKKYKESLEFFRKSYLNNPDNPVNIYNKALVLFKTGDLNESQNLFKILLQDKNFKNEYVHYFLGEINYKKNNLYESKVYYIKSLKIKPDFINSKIKLQLINNLIDNLKKNNNSDSAFYVKTAEEGFNTSVSDINKLSENNSEKILDIIIEFNRKIILEKSNKHQNNKMENMLW